LQKDQEELPMTEAEWLACTDPYFMIAHLRQEERGWRQRWAAWFGLRSYRSRRRLLYLFACGCCRRLWQLLADERSRWAIEVCERYVDGGARKKEMRRAGEAAVEAAFDAESPRLAHGSWLGAAQARAAEAVAGIFDAREGPVKGALWAREAARAVGKGARSNLVSGALPPIALPQQVWYPWDSWSGTKTATAKQDLEAAAAEAAWQAEGQIQCELLRDICGDHTHLPKLQAAWRTAEVTNLARKIYDEFQFESMLHLASALQKAGCDDSHILNHCASEHHTRGCWLIDLILGRSGERGALAP
jgi:hypothetical protein